ncbi:hypothetical protein C8R34_12543 [Nitrosomonas sp. Nm84]|uniref:hypothetical protein n=1 Tax=Nitrosomonas sp. Nm84 TaxID=200124 RepID=UPI000D755D87|nr:hypothetical protein [Nitrosomonas sp. Nm84]PXW83905.1 hypothetical protein C8R34_12543 [Nitrosomonas sp. Nm84]
MNFSKKERLFFLCAAAGRAYWAANLFHITSVQGREGVVFVDGFFEPQALQSLARMTQSGKNA